MSARDRRRKIRIGVKKKKKKLKSLLKVTPVDQCVPDLPAHYFDMGERWRDPTIGGKMFFPEARHVELTAGTAAGSIMSCECL